MNGARSLRALWRGDGGISAVEFALAMPILLAIGGYGVEIANLSLTHLRVSQAALYLADNASRVGLTSNLATTQLRESDINDIFRGLALQTDAIDLTTFGRVTLSSLERQSNGSQLIHWQRCIGKKVNVGTGASTVYYDSSYGTAAYGSSGTTVTSMGDSATPVTAPAGTAVMFVEINYDYQPLFGRTYVATQRLHYVASYLVRDSRDYSQVYGPATPSKCADHNDTVPT